MTATYRLQLHAGFTFADASAVVPYLAELGITHLYLSPILQAAEGSTHGYDVVDPERVSIMLGGEQGFTNLVATARAHELGILLDVVPNHMSISGTGNQWWLDVLENGIASYYAHFFDVDWLSGDDRVSLPVLGERYGRALATGLLGVVHDGAGGFAIRAGELRLPIAPRAVSKIVRRTGDRIGHRELAFVGDALDLPRVADPDIRRRRHRDKAVLLGRLRELARDPEIASALDAEVAEVNADRVELDAILESQAYRLVHWSVSGSQLSYRRFFDINTLVGIRNEDPEVFDASHARIIGWLANKTIDGIRIDHVDGLRDPARYFARLREVAPYAWIVVEKILGADERQPAWPIDGTTGYDFNERVSCLLVDPAGERPLTEIFEAYTGVTFDPSAASRAARLEVMSDALHSEVSRLVEIATRACAVSPTCRDYTRAEIETALEQLFAGYPVYRTYFDPSRSDRARIATAAAATTDVDGDLLGFLEAALAFEVNTPDALELARSAQQVTGAIVAKGDEDTVGYRQVRLVSRCEVGAELRHFTCDPAAIHRALATGPPRSLLATSTHDTKRGEDVRARISVLSEVAAAWAQSVTRWRDRADAHWGDVAPDRTLEYAIWQTLVGAWPIDCERTKTFALKA
ncbi:MAG TPA: malto-oligosyltrehalose synthase, partial [Kofleriaceae bacterium]|nr:malto-oligosyltrehalose synthase [Kofleriaceae bacterium]